MSGDSEYVIVGNTAPTPLSREQIAADRAWAKFLATLDRRPGRVAFAYALREYNRFRAAASAPTEET